MFRSTRHYRDHSTLGDIIEDPNTFVQRVTDKSVDTMQRPVGSGADVYDAVSVIAPSGKIGKIASQLQTASQLVSQPLNPMMLIPGGQLLTVAKLIPGAEKLLAPITGIMNSVLGPVKGIIGGITNKVFGRFFKKATHMGDCMKWWNNENNIRGMASGVQPLPISLDQFYSNLYKNMDRTMRQRFDERQAKGDIFGTDSLLNIGMRQRNVVNNFLAQMRANPEIKQMACLSQPNVQRETGQYDITPAYVESIFSQFRQQAQEAEYNQTMAELQKKFDPQNALQTILQISKETWGRVEAKRESNSLIPSMSTKSGVPFTFPVYTSGGSLIHNVGPATINKGFPIIPKVK